MDFLQNKADKAKISSFNGSKSGFYSTADWESFSTQPFVFRQMTSLKVNGTVHGLHIIDRPHIY